MSLDDFKGVGKVLEPALAESFVLRPVANKVVVPDGTAVFVDFAVPDDASELLPNCAAVVA